MGLDLGMVEGLVLAWASSALESIYGSTDDYITAPLLFDLYVLWEVV